MSFDGKRRGSLYIGRLYVAWTLQGWRLRKVMVRCLAASSLKQSLRHRRLLDALAAQENQEE